MLKQKIAPTFKRDIKRLKKKHADTEKLKEVMMLVLLDTKESLYELERHHKMHTLKGAWKGSLEWHVANAGDWLLIWCVSEGFDVFQRTGSHDDLFKC